MTLGFNGIVEKADHLVIGMFGKVFIVSCLLAYLEVTAARRAGYKKFPEPVAEVIKSARPHTYLKATDLPDRWDWRDVNGTNYCGKVLTQQSPNVCGSCWAEAATGALSDRFTIATQGKLRVALAPQALLNFNQLLTGGTCNGGDHLKAYEFAHKHGIADDTCQVFVGMDAAHGFEINEYTDADDIRAHQCYLCEWNGVCGFAPQGVFDVYGADEYGNVLGVDEMKAEIYARGPIACSINSEANAFNYYQGGVIKCDDKLDVSCKSPLTDHVIIIAGWGVEEATGTPYWVGRNSYGTRWGEGAGGGWFRLELGTNQLNLESNTCSFAVPAQADVDRALKQFASSSGY